MEMIFLKDALFSGMTSNAFKIGTVLTLGWFWVRNCGCILLFRGSDIEQINTDEILSVGDTESQQISPPGYLQHEASSTYFYLVRRVNRCGSLEQTLRAIARVAVDSEGKLTKEHPNSVTVVSIEQNNGSIKLSWFYCPLGQESVPVCFKIYSDDGGGQIDYENSIETIEYEGRGLYRYQSGQLQAGRYKFAIRVEDVDGAQDGYLGFAEIEITDANVPSAGILSVEAV